MSLNPLYARPRSVEQATQLLAGLGSGAMVVAGGQELVPSMNYGRLALEVIVDINGLDEMRGIRVEDGELSIGALTVHRDLQSDDNVRAHAPLLAYAAAQVGGGRQVHNRGTIGGNIVSMHPLYDIVPPLLALEAAVEISSGSGKRRVTLIDLMSETKHGLGVSSLLTRVMVPIARPGSGWAYEKLKTTHGAYGSANAAVVVELDAQGRAERLMLAIGGAADRPLVVTDRIADLLPAQVTRATADLIGTRTAAAVKEPLSDHQGDAAYRRAMAGVMAGRAFVAACASAGAPI